VLRFEQIQLAAPGAARSLGTGTQLRWQAAPGLRYHIHRNTNLNNPHGWQEIGVVVPDSSIGSFFDVFVADDAFYQISTDGPTPPAAGDH
jgi:hypothetical protein